jgi:hypothetical protein
MTDKGKLLIANISWWLAMISIAAIAFFSCHEKPVASYPTLIVTSEQACLKVFTNGKKRIDSFIALRESNPPMSPNWLRYEDSVKKEIAYVFKELDTTGGKLTKYIMGDRYK